MLLVTLAEKIRRLRGGRAYAELARAAGCSAPTVRDIATGQRRDPSIRIIAGIAAFLDVSIDWLVDDEQGWPPPGGRDEASQLVRQALAGAGLIGDVSPEEREFLLRWRALPPELQQRALGYLIGLSGGVVK